MSQQSAPTIPGYELIRELGVGGMATVYLAIQRSLERKIAIKIMRRGGGGDDIEKAEKRFLVEGRTMAKLPHRNIVAVYDIVKQEDYSYIAMEYLEGGTLSDSMKKGLSLAEAISIVAQIAGALQFAHDHGVVHRDLKPANIMFRDEHTPVLTDFGIAKQQDSSATRLTQTGMLVGTPTYMSPEQINALDVDGRSDLYSLGVLFFELLTGRPPFRGDTPIAVLMSHLTTPAPPLPDQFREFQIVLDKMLAKSRDDRFASMKEFTRALKAAVTHDQTLWQRLQADPNQSSSEQLRALGFSISTQEGSGTDLHRPRENLPNALGNRTTGELASRAAGLLSNAPPTEVLPAGREAKIKATENAATSISKKPRASANQQNRAAPAVPEAKSKKWILPALATLALMLLVGAWLVFKPRELDSATQKIVDSELLQYDDAFARGDLIEPSDKSALDRMLNLREVAPKYSPIVERISKLEEAIVARAKELSLQGDFDGAIIAAKKLQEFDPDYAGLEVLLDEISKSQRIALNKKEVDRLVTSATVALNANQLFGPEGAYAQIQKARNLIADYPASEDLLKRLLEQALRPMRRAIQVKDFTLADAEMARLKPNLANEGVFKILETQLQSAKLEAQKQAQLAAFFVRFDRQIAAGQLIVPTENSARATLEEARRLVGDNNPELKIKQSLLVEKLVDGANRLLTAGKASDAVALADTALQLDAASGLAQQVRRNAESQLSARERQIAQALSDAREALAAQRFVAPADDNVKRYLDQVISLDAGQVEAKKMLSELPTQLANAIEAALQADNLERAEVLLQSAQNNFTSDNRFAQLAKTISTKKQTALANASRNQMLEKISQNIARRPMLATESAASARELQTLLVRNPRDVDAAALRQRLIEALIEESNGAQNKTDLIRLQSVLDNIRIPLAGSPALADALRSLEATRARIDSLEAARLASTGGVLIIDAAPWARVESVLDASQQKIALPSSRETPMRLELPAGVYTIYLSHPNLSAQVTQTARVITKQEVVASKLISVGSREEYLKRARL